MRMIKNKRKLRLLTPLFCSIGVLIAGQAFAGTPSVTLNADKERGNIAESGRLGYVGGSTRIGVSIDKNLQGQVDVNQIIAEDDISATSVEGWFGYQIKDKNGATKGIKGAGVKLNHLWVERGGKYQSDTVHKAFGAYDKNTADHAKITAGYGQEQRDLFWSGHVSKGISGKSALGSPTTTHQTYEKAYDYGVGGEVGTFLEDSLTRIRGGVDYEWGTDHANTEDKPTQATISAGVQQYFYDSPHSVTLDISASKKSGGSTTNTTNSNARVGYQYEFAKVGTFQSNKQVKRTRVEIPGSPAIAAIPSIAGKPAKYSKKEIKTPYTKLVKTTMKLENETFFKLNSSQLTASAKQNINKIVAEIRRNSYTGAIRITGNTCGLGSATYDQRLSERRANTVKQYLIKAGLNPSHLIARGLGKDHPKYRNEPASGFKNRRVDIEYVSQRSVKKKAYKTEYKDILISAATTGRPGKAGVAATPARFIWKTEEIKSAPVWVKRALHNPIRHKRSVDTYQTQTALNAVDDIFTLTSREGLLDVLANDSSGLTDLTIITQPQHGTATVVDGQVQYEADSDFTGGTDQFTYQVIDADGNTHTATVTVTIPVTAHNVAPVANNDSVTTNVNTSITLDIIANDEDADNDVLSLESVTNPTHGLVTINGNEITYSPDDDFEGTDQFTYTVTDGKGHTDTATVTIVVGNATTNVAPIAVDDMFQAVPDTDKVYNVVSNDNDTDGDDLTISGIPTQPSKGTVSFSGTEVTYTANSGETGEDTFTYTITDGNGHTDTATVTVTISDTANAAPDARNDSYTATKNDSALIFDVLDNDDDPEDDTLTISNVSSTTSQGGIAIISDNKITYTPKSDFVGSDTFTYTITDGQGNEDSATATVTIYDTPETPVLSPNYAATYGDTSVTIPVLDDDTAPSGSTLTLTGVHSNPDHGTVSVDTSSGTVTYTPEDGYTGTFTFTYEATDSNGFTGTAMVTVNVQTSEDRGASDDFIEIDINDTPQPEHNLVNNDSAGLTICSGSISGNSGDSSVNISADNTSISYSPNSYSGATDSFDYDVCDTDGSKVDTATVHIALGGFGGGANQAPTAGTDTGSVDGGSYITIDVLDNDNDADSDTLTLVGISENGSHGHADIYDGNIVYTADTDYSGSDSVTYVLTDSHGHYVYGTINITITNVANSAPTIDNISAININAGDYSTTNTDLASYFHDSNSGDTVYLANAYAASGSLDFNDTTIQYTPKSGEATSGTTDTIYITVSDGKDEVSSTITVNFN